MIKIEASQVFISSLSELDVIYSGYGTKIWKTKDGTYYFKNKQDEYFHLHVDEILIVLKKYGNCNKPYCLEPLNNSKPRVNG